MLVAGMPYPAVAAAASAIGVTVFDTPTITPATVNSTTTTLVGTTPVATFMVGSHHLAANDPGSTPHAQIMFSSIANSSYVAWTQSETGQAATEVYRNALSSAAVRFQNDGGGVTNPASSSQSLIAGGITTNYNTSSVARRVMHSDFGKIGSQAANGKIGLGTGTSAISVNCGFEPDFVILYGTCGQDGGGGGFFTYSVGVATKNGDQHCVLAGEVNARAAGNAPQQAILSNRAGGQINLTDGAKAYDLTVGGFSASGFTVTPSASTTSDDIFYLAVKGHSAKIIPFTTPTSTGTQIIAGAGFAPTYALAFLTNLESTDPTFPISASNLMAGLGIGMIGTEDQWSKSYRIQNGADPTSTASNVKNVAILGPSNTSTSAISATLASFDSDGMTLDYSAVQGTAKRGFILFLA